MMSSNDGERSEHVDAREPKENGLDKMPDLDEPDLDADADRDQQNQDTYDDLLTAIETSEGQLSLLIAVCDNPLLREEIIQRYETDLAPEIRSYRLTLTRGEPSLSAAIRHAIAEQDYLHQGGRAVFTVTGIEQLHFLSLGDEKSEQEVFFGYLQWTREALREFTYPIVIWVTYQILAQLSRKSPDFWSWRKGVFRFVSRKTTAIPLRELDTSIFERLDLPDLDEDSLLPLDDLNALIQHTEKKNSSDPLLVTLYSQMGKVYAERLGQGIAQDYPAEQAQAIQYLEKAIALQKDLGQEIGLADSLTWLGYLYKLQRRYSDAKSLVEQALELRQRILGADHADVAANLNNLAVLYCLQGDFSEAESLVQQALILSQRLLGKEHQHVATSLNNLALLYQLRGRFNEAESLLVQALAIREQRLGSEHPHTIATRQLLQQVQSTV